jgi:hypothetical protein
MQPSRGLAISGYDLDQLLMTEADRSDIREAPLAAGRRPRRRLGALVDILHALRPGQFRGFFCSAFRWAVLGHIDTVT